MKTSNHALLILALCVASAGVGRATTITWTNTASGGWNTADNWDSHTVPGTGDTAVIDQPGVTVSLNSATTIGSIALGGNSGTAVTLLLAGQTLDLEGSLTVNPSGSFTVDNGTLAGSTGNATLIGAIGWTAGDLAGTLTIAANGTLTVDNGGSVNDMPNTVLTNNGTVVWVSGTIRGGGNPSGTAIYNNGLWDCQSDQTLQNAFGGSVGMVFNNTGTFRKSGGAGEFVADTLISVLFNQLAGVIDVQNGTGTNGLQLDFQGGGIFTGGYITTNQYGLTVLSQGSFNLNGTVTGTNTWEDSGDLAGTANVIDGALTWKSGNWNATSNVTITPNSTLYVVGGASVNDMANCQVTNYGTVVWVSGTIRGGGDPFGTAIYNNGLWDCQSDQQLQNAYGGVGMVFNNNATFRKSGGAGELVADTLIASGVLFNQLAGVIDVQNSTNGLQLDFQGGANLTGGYITTNQHGLIVLSQGSFNINGTVISTNTWEDSGNLVGTNVIIGALTWIGGNWDSATSVTITPNSTLYVVGGAGVNDMENCQVTNHGTVEWVSGDIRGGGDPFGTAIYNDGLWDCQSDQQLQNVFGGVGMVFNNNATFRKSGGAGELVADTLIASGVLFNQLAGVIDVQNGTNGLQLDFQGGANLTGGYVTTNQHGLIVLSQGSFNINGTVISTNTWEDSGNLVGNNVIIGALTWIAGDWDSATSVTIAPNTTLYVAGAAGVNDMENCQVTNNGTVVWQSGTIRGGGDPFGTIIYNHGVWDCQSDQQLQNVFGGQGTVFNNTGTLLKSGGVSELTNATVFTGGVLMNQLAGVIDVRDGTNGLQLAFQGGGNFTGGYITTNQFGLTTLEVTGYNINGTVTGSNTWEADNGNLVGTNVIHGGLTWISGTWDSAVVTIAPSTTVLVAGAAGDNDMQDTIVTNNGTVAWATGTIRGGGDPGTFIYNYGLWDCQSDQLFQNVFGGVGTAFNNFGTLRKSGGVSELTNATVFSGVSINQIAGAIDVQNGTNGLQLAFQGGGNLTGGYITTNQFGLTTLEVTGYTINGTVTGSNTWEADNGNLAGKNVIRGGLTWVSGTWDSAVVTIAPNTTVTVAGAAGNNDMGNTIVTNNGTVAWASGNIRGGGDPGTFIYNNGLWNALSDQTLSDTFGGVGVVFTNSGTFLKSGTSGGSTLLQSTVAFDNPGTLDAQVGNISSQGTFTPDHGTMRFGLTSTTNYGTVSLSTALSIDGTLSLDLLGGFAPALGDSFTLITSSADSSTFDNLNLTTLPTGDAWQVNYDAAKVVLQVVAFGASNSEITGSVNDAPTHGVPNINVFAFNTNNPSVSVYVSTTTGSTGLYTLDVTNGNWTVGLSNLTADGYIPVPDQTTTTSSLQSTQVVDFLIQAIGATIPAATTTTQSSVTPTGATLNGTVNPNGEAVTVFFEYGTTGLTQFSATNTLTASLNSSQPVGIPIAGLSPATSYQFQIVAENSVGTNVGGILNFMTAGIAPVVVTLPATDIGPTNATVNGTVNPGGLTTTYYFEYGTNTDYGSFTVTNPLPAGISAILVTNALSNLQPATVYHFQLVAANNLGTNGGGDLTFTNLPAAPTVQTLAASPVSANSATLNGSVNPNGLPTTWYFEYGADTTYGHFTPTNSLLPTNLLMAVSSVLSGLNADAVYHFQLVAANSLGTNDGGDLTFSTQTVPATITCPPDITTNQATGECSQVVAFAPVVSGTPTPTLTCEWNGNPITSPFSFPVGTNLVTCTAMNQAGTNSCSFTVTVVDTNPPVAGLDSLGTYENQTASVAVSKMLLRDSAPSGGTLSIPSVTPSTPHGGSVTLGGGLITYVPQLNYFGLDYITYALFDGCGTVQGTITVTVLATNLPANNYVSISATVPPTVVFAGVPGATYVIQAAPATSGPWANLGIPVQAAANGLIQFTDTTSPLPPIRFYRTQYVSGP